MIANAPAREKKSKRRSVRPRTDNPEKKNLW